MSRQTSKKNHYEYSENCLDNAAVEFSQNPEGGSWGYFLKVAEVHAILAGDFDPDPEREEERERRKSSRWS